MGINAGDPRSSLRPDPHRGLAQACSHRISRPGHDPRMLADLLAAGESVLLERLYGALNRRGPAGGREHEPRSELDRSDDRGHAGLPSGSIAAQAGLLAWFGDQAVCLGVDADVVQWPG